MKALKHLRPAHEDWFVVNWCLGNTCNFSCSYCPKNLHDGSKAWPGLDIITAFVDRVFEQKVGRRLAFEFTGGEVTVYRQFPDLCNYIKGRGGAVGFISNGSRTLRYWEDFRGRADHACLSFHAEEGDPKHFINVVKTLHDNMQVHVNVMMHPDKWDLCVDLANRVTEVPGITMAIQPLIVDFGSQLYHYTPSQNQIFKDQWKLFQSRIPRSQRQGLTWRGAMKLEEPGKPSVPQQPHIMISQLTNNWAGWHCAAGVEQVIVDMDQTVWRGWCRQGGRIGHIADANLQLPTEWVLCKKDFCHCNFDIMTTKIKR